MARDDRQDLREIAQAAFPLPGESSVSLHQWARVVSPARVLRLLDEGDRHALELVEYQALKAGQPDAADRLTDALALRAEVETEWDTCRSVCMAFYRAIKAHPEVRWPGEVLAAMSRLETAGIHRYDYGTEHP